MGHLAASMMATLLLLAPSVSAATLFYADSGNTTHTGMLNCTDTIMKGDCDFEKWIQDGMESQGAGMWMVIGFIVFGCCCFCMCGRLCCNCCGGSTPNPQSCCTGAQKDPETKQVPKLTEEEHKRLYWYQPGPDGTLQPAPCYKPNPVGAKVLMLVPIFLCVVSFALVYASVPQIMDGYNALWKMLDTALAWMEDEVAAIRRICTLPNGNFITGIDTAYFDDVDRAISQAKTQMDDLKDGPASKFEEFAVDVGMGIGAIPFLFAICGVICCMTNMRGAMHPLFCCACPCAGILFIAGGITMLLAYTFDSACTEIKQIRDGDFSGYLAGDVLGKICPAAQLQDAKSEIELSRQTNLRAACAQIAEVCDSRTDFPGSFVNQDFTSAQYLITCAACLPNPVTQSLPQTCANPDCLTTTNVKKIYYCDPSDLTDSQPMCSNDIGALSNYLHALSVKNGVPNQYACAAGTPGAASGCSPIACADDCTDPQATEQRRISREVRNADTMAQRAHQAYTQHLEELLDCGNIFRKVIGGYNPEPDVQQNGTVPVGWVDGCKDVSTGTGGVGFGLVIGGVALAVLSGVALCGQKRFIGKMKEDPVPQATAKVQPLGEVAAAMESGESAKEEPAVPSAPPEGEQKETADPPLN